MNGIRKLFDNIESLDQIYLKRQLTSMVRKKINDET